MNKQTILVIVNEMKTIRSIQDSLTMNNEQNVNLITSNNSDIAIDMAWKEKPNLILIGSSFPDISGTEIVGILKKNQPTNIIPIIMIGDNAENSNIDEEKTALALGVNDYIKMPFNHEIFKLRSQNIIKQSLTKKVEQDKDEILESGKITLNMSSHTAYISNKEIDLTPKEFALLYLFVKKRGKVLNRVFLSETIWEHKYSNTSHTIDKHVANLRKKLGPEGNRIETMPTIGYKFV